MSQRLLRPAKSRSSSDVALPTLLPPKLDEFGHQPFTASDHQSLARWLRESAWPRGTLNIYGLEGYLTALLVWPVGLQPGAWLPPIWNEDGWRVRPPIDTAQRYREFLEVVLGFLRHIDGGLLQVPAIFEPHLHPAGHADLDLKRRTQHWAQGFGRGLRQGVQARGAPALEAREAVRTIATYATDQPRVSIDSTYRAAIDITQAVLTLAKTRSSRGPLGVLSKQQIATEGPATQIPAPKGSSPLENGA